MNDTNQFLTFTLEEEQYAIPVQRVREVLEYTKITKIPKTATYMKGVINLRGIGVPVIDFRSKFGMDEIPLSKDTSIIVMEVSEKDTEDSIILGALADSVQEVIELDSDSIEKAPRFGTRLSTEFIQGMGKKDGAFIIILDIDKIFSSEEVNFLNSVEKMAEAVDA
ncbi:chemotaxis protein CheW [Treponema sp.]